MIRLIACMSVFSALLAAQSPPPIGTPTLYRLFFGHLTTLDSEATKLDTSGGNGQALRSYYKNAIGLDNSEEILLKQYASLTLAAVKTVDQKAQVIIQQVRAQSSGGRLASPRALPPPPPELQQLTKERDDVTNTQIGALRGALGTASFAKIDGYVHTKFAKQVSAAPIVPHPPAGGPLSASGPQANGGKP